MSLGSIQYLRSISIPELCLSGKKCQSKVNSRQIIQNNVYLLIHYTGSSRYWISIHGILWYGATQGNRFDYNKEKI